MICIVGIRVNVNSNSRLETHSDEMDRALPAPQQHWSTMLSKKSKENNKKKILEDIGVMRTTQKLVGLRHKVRYSS